MKRIWHHIAFKGYMPFTPSLKDAKQKLQFFLLEYYNASILWGSNTHMGSVNI